MTLVASLNFLDDQGIRLHHLGGELHSLYRPHARHEGQADHGPGWVWWCTVENSVNYDPITEEVVLQALELVISPAASPLMIMCNLGRHRTGTVVGICKHTTLSPSTLTPLGQRATLASLKADFASPAAPNSPNRGRVQSASCSDGTSQASSRSTGGKRAGLAPSSITPPLQLTSELPTSDTPDPKCAC